MWMETVFLLRSDIFRALYPSSSPPPPPHHHPPPLWSQTILTHIDQRIEDWSCGRGISIDTIIWMLWESFSFFSLSECWGIEPATSLGKGSEVFASSVAKPFKFNFFKLKITVNCLQPTFCYRAQKSCDWETYFTRHCCS